MMSLCGGDVGGDGQAEAGDPGGRAAGVHPGEPLDDPLPDNGDLSDLSPHVRSQYAEDTVRPPRPHPGWSRTCRPDPPAGSGSSTPAGGVPNGPSSSQSDPVTIDITWDPTGDEPIPTANHHQRLSRGPGECDQGGLPVGALRQRTVHR